ncbi:MAG TPA: hypothetical protein VEC36_07580 [Patescibacteria group bacterium]|nr:hypothetical protein [Patescibacteria group bacterium]
MKRKIILMLHEDVAIEIHIAKVDYTPQDEETFKKLINSIKIIED